MINLRTASGDWIGLKAFKHSTLISHLFFADDLILFAKANGNDCDCIMEVLSEFCEISGQKINFQKSKMYVSPNIPRREALPLSYQCGMTLTNDLGKYLGTPLLYGRITNLHTKDIIERMSSKLSGRKAKNLSLAGRITLIKSVTSVIPNHLMQTMELPRDICNKIDRLNRNFLWGSTENAKKVHLVNWQNVCKSKKQGGLGIRKAREQNLALITKLGWKVASNSADLWCSILKSKYLTKHSFSSWANKRLASHTWKSIIKNRYVLEKNIKWSVATQWLPNPTTRSPISATTSSSRSLRRDIWISVEAPTYFKWFKGTLKSKRLSS
ncbi:unnamed protein product [Camellia sinensis]